jgi:hypothetical protein
MKAKPLHVTWRCGRRISGVQRDPLPVRPWFKFSVPGKMRTPAVRGWCKKLARVVAQEICQTPPVISEEYGRSPAMDAMYDFVDTIWSAPNLPTSGIALPCLVPAWMRPGNFD